MITIDIIITMIPTRQAGECEFNHLMLEDICVQN